MTAPLLITAAELGTWTGKTAEQIQADPLAVDVMQRVSDYARFLASDPGPAGGDPGPAADWTYDTAPFDVRLMVLMVAKRSYENPRLITAEGGVGPIGGDTFAAAAALGMQLTDAERATCTKYNLSGDPQSDGSPGLWTQPVIVADASTSGDAILYVGDNLQVGLTDSSDPREWKIPLFNPLDPGDPALYPEG